MRLRARLIYIFLVASLNGQSNINGFDIGSWLSIFLFWMYAIPYLSRVSRLDYLHARLISLFEPMETDNEANSPKDEKATVSNDISLEGVKKNNKESNSANDKPEIDSTLDCDDSKENKDFTNENKVQILHEQEISSDKSLDSQTSLRESNDIKVTLTVDNGGSKVTTVLGFEAVENIYYRTRDISENSELFKILSHHASHNIRSNIAQKKNLPLDRLISLASDDSDEVRNSVVNNEVFQKNATLDQIKNILAKGQSAGESVVSSASYFKKVSTDDIEKAIDELDNPGPRLLQYAAQSYDFSTEFIQKFTTHEDADIAATAKETIKNRAEY